MLPRGLRGKESPTNARDASSIPGLGRSPGEGKGNPLQCSCLENPMDTGVTVVHDTVLNTQKLLREYLLNVFTTKKKCLLCAVDGGVG